MAWLGGFIPLFWF